MTLMEKDRPYWNKYFLSIAEAVACRASCTRRKVGAVLTKDNRIIATGYNGAPAGDPDCLQGACPRGAMSLDEVPPLSDYDRPGTSGFCVAVHAELNALLHATRDTDGSKMYVTDPPCPGCRKAMAAAGVILVAWPGGTMSRQRMTDWSVIPS